MSNDLEFKIGDVVIYPSHGMGEIIEIESQTIADTKLEVYVISFPQAKMTLRVPVSRAAISGLRALSGANDITEAYDALSRKPKRGDKMWSRRAQGYETKINSGNIVSIAEVVCDLHKNVDNDRSYSERVIYESALHRLASEIAKIEKISEEAAVEKVVDLLKEKQVAA